MDSDQSIQNNKHQTVACFPQNYTRVHHTVQSDSLAHLLTLPESQDFVILFFPRFHTPFRPVKMKDEAGPKQHKGGYRQINKTLNICAFEDYLEAQLSNLPYIADVEQVTPRVLRVLGQNAGKVPIYLLILPLLTDPAYLAPHKHISS